MIEPRVDRFDAVVGFVDLAGFTHAAEVLGESGPLGTEELSQLINGLFTPLIARIHAAGGEIGWFAGDAVGVLFDTEVTPASMAIRTLSHAAAELRQQPPVETSRGPLTLGVKVGIAAGAVVWSEIGDDHVLPWFGGAAIDDSAEAEGYASPGDVVIHPSAVIDALRAELEPLDDGFQRLIGEDVDAPAPLPGALTSAATDLARRRQLRYQPERAARLAGAAREAFLDEHRPVTAVFQQMPTERHDADVLADLRSIAAELGGVLQTATEGDKGAMTLSLFGAPTALADRDSAAVIAATRMRDRVPGSSVGVASGRLFAGRVGSPARWDYSVIGDRANTAARLMQAAGPDEVLIDSRTAAAADLVVRLGERRDLVLKGKEDPEPAFPVIATRSTSTGIATDGAFVGRRDEIDWMLRALEEPGLRLLTARAGTGKSRLTAQALGLAAQQVSTIVLAQSDRGRPFTLWQTLLPTLLPDLQGVDARLDDERFPLLAPVLGRPIDDSPLTAALEPSDRRELLANYLTELVARASADSAIVIEDLHWADADSIGLLARASAAFATAGVSVIATARPEPNIDPVRPRSGHTHLELQPLDQRDMEELARRAWDDRFGVEPTGGMTTALVERSHGSPLFCQQLVAYAASAGVAPRAPGLPSSIGIPDDLTDLLLARLERLSEGGNTVASLAAVARDTIDLTTLRGAFGHRYPEATLVEGLSELRDRGVLVGTTKHRFAHSLFADATHDRLSFGLRADLHLDVVEHLERSDDTSVATLARHSENIVDEDRKRRYFRGAADEAAEQFAGEVASYWYEQLVPLLDRVDRGPVHLAVGEIEAVSGDIERAEQHLVAAIEDLDGLDAVPAELALSRVLLNQGQTTTAFEHLDALIDRTEQAAAWDDLHAALDRKADLATMLGDLERAEEVEAHHARLIAEFGDHNPATQALPGLTMLSWMRGDFETVREAYERFHYERLAAGDLVRAATYAGDLAGIAASVGEPVSAYGWLETAGDLMRRTGDIRQRSLLHSMESDLRMEAGDISQAAAAATTALEVAVTAHDPRAMMAALAAVGRLPGLVNGAEWLQRALVLADAVGEQAFVSDMHGYLAEITRSERPSAASQIDMDIDADLLRLLLENVDDRPELAGWQSRIPAAPLPSDDHTP